VCYNGYNQDQYQYQYPNQYQGQYPDQYPDQYQNQHPYQYPGHCGCPIYPVPFMPTNPMYAHAYVPYQTYTMTYPLAEALEKGTLFPELVNVYNPYEDYRKVGK